MFVYFVGIEVLWILFSFLSTIIYGVLYTLSWCLRYNICSAWFLDIRISTCYNSIIFVYAATVIMSFPQNHHGTQRHIILDVTIPEDIYSSFTTIVLRLNAACNVDWKFSGYRFLCNTILVSNTGWSELALEAPYK